MSCPPNRRSRQTALAWLSVATALVTFSACSSDSASSGPEEPPSLPMSPAVVSAPESGAAGALRGIRGGLLTPGVAYVSMQPGSDSLGVVALIRNGPLGVPVVVPMVDGGFDPVVVGASPGDTLQVSIQRTTGAVVVGYSVVPVRSRPVVVRTSPPRRKTDIPLNSIVRVVFSQPIDSLTLPAALRLRLDGATVPGAVVPTVSGSVVLEAAFVPASLLEPSSEYELEVSTVVKSTGGDPLATAVVVTFTTRASGGPLPPLSGLAINLPLPLFSGSVVPLGSVITPAVEVTWQGYPGDTMYAGDVTLTLGAHPAGATMLGTTAVPMVDGRAYFDDITFDRAGTYTLVASAPGARSDTSFAFTVAATAYWIERAAMPTPRQAVGVGVVNGVLYAVGGADPNGLPSAALEAYDPATGTWTPRAAMPTARYGFGLGVINDTIYAVGGVTAGGATAVVEAYDPATDTWTTRASLPAPRGFPGAGVVNGVLYAVGGQQPDSTILATVLAYDPVADQWSLRAPLPGPRSHVGVGISNGLLYAIGGLTTPIPTYTTVVSTIEAYDPVADAWSTPPSSGYTPGRLLPAIAVRPGAPGNICIFSGVDGVTYLRDPYAVSDLYSPTNGTFTRLPGAPWAFSMQAAGVVNDLIYLVGYQTFEYHP